MPVLAVSQSRSPADFGKTVRENKGVALKEVGTQNSRKAARGLQSVLGQPQLVVTVLGESMSVGKTKKRLWHILILIQLSKMLA